MAAKDRGVPERVLRCFVRGRGDRWDAMCIDLDIAVEGASRREVVSRLEDAIAGYVESACAEGGEQAKRLLNRRAPWRVRLAVVFGSTVHVLFRTRPGRELRGSFDLACPA